MSDEQTFKVGDIVMDQLVDEQAKRIARLETRLNIMEDAYFHLQNKRDFAEHKNEKLESQVTKLEKQIAMSFSSEEMQVKQKQNIELLAQVTKLRAALEYYADKKNWGQPTSDMRDWYMIESKDRGNVARAALQADGEGG